MPARKGNERPDHQPPHQNQRQSAAYTVRELHQCFNSRGNRDDLTVAQRPVAPAARARSRRPHVGPPQNHGNGVAQDPPGVPDVGSLFHSLDLTMRESRKGPPPTPPRRRPFGRTSSGPPLTPLESS